MVDVIFLLLIFFLLTTSYTPPEARLTPALQAQRVSGGRAADLEPQIVLAELINGAPAYRVGERVLRDQTALQQLLASLPKEAGVFVRADDALPVRWPAAALQAAYDAGFTKVTYVPGN
jgi:biopolymer transport protein ExbD